MSSSGYFYGESGGGLGMGGRGRGRTGSGRGGGRKGGGGGRGREGGGSAAAAAAAAAASEWDAQSYEPYDQQPYTAAPDQYEGYDPYSSHHGQRHPRLHQQYQQGQHQQHQQHYDPRGYYSAPSSQQVGYGQQGGAQRDSAYDANATIGTAASTNPYSSHSGGYHQPPTPQAYRDAYDVYQQPHGADYGAAAYGYGYSQYPPRAPSGQNSGYHAHQNPYQTAQNPPNVQQPGNRRYNHYPVHPNVNAYGVYDPFAHMQPWKYDKNCEEYRAWRHWKRHFGKGYNNNKGKGPGGVKERANNMFHNPANQAPVTPAVSLTDQQIETNARLATERSKETSALKGIEFVTDVKVCSGNDRYILVDIVGPEETVYAEGTYILEIFMGKEYPDEYPLVRFATRIVNPHVDILGRIAFPKPPPEDGPSLKALLTHVLDTIMKAEIPEESRTKAANYNWKYGLGNTDEEELDPNDPIRNWGPGRVSEILACTERDLVSFVEFFKRLEFQNEGDKSEVNGFKLNSKDADVATGGPPQASGGRAMEKSSSSRVGNWSKGATVDEGEPDDGAALQFQPQNTEEALYAVRSKPSAPLNYSEHSFLTLSHAISQSTLNAITKTMGFTKMTVEQCQMLPAVLEGKDILVRSNTGTGKTISFLIPCIERATMFMMTANVRDTQMSALIISPTRELASQIGDMAQQLLFFNDQITIDIFMGGKNINSEVARCEETYPTILIVTPGRMLDHLERDVGELKKQLANLNTLVLDESDQLLAAGFLPSIETILSHIPMSSPDLQSMMFSATVPPSLHGVVSSTLKNDGYFLDADKTKTKWGLSQFNDETNKLLSNSSTSTDPKTENIAEAMKRAAQLAKEEDIIDVSGNGRPGNGDETINQGVLTNFKDIVGPSIVQFHVVSPLSRQAAMLKRLLGLATARKNYKVIVFFQTARATAYFVSLMYEMHKIDVLEMHSRKSQPHRAHVSHKFKSETNQILFTSDVSARGVDYPNVTCCIQVGLPQNLENYIHRCGRSGRGVQGGLSIVLLSDFEKVFLDELSKEGIHVPQLDVDFGEDDGVLQKLEPPDKFFQSKELINRAKLHYQAWIGYYCSHIKRLKMEKEGIVELSIIYSKEVLLLEEIPAIRASTAEKMAVVGIKGIRIEDPEAEQERERNKLNRGNSSSWHDRREHMEGGYIMYPSSHMRGRGRGGGRGRR